METPQSKRCRDLEALNKKEYQIEQQFEESKQDLCRVYQKRIINFKRFKQENFRNPRKCSQMRKYLKKSQVLEHQQRLKSSQEELEKAILYHLKETYQDGRVSEVYLSSIDFAVSYPTAYLESVQKMGMEMKRKQKRYEYQWGAESESNEELIEF